MEKPEGINYVNTF